MTQKEIGKTTKACNNGVTMIAYLCMRAEEIVLENKLDSVLLTLLATNEPTMNDIPKELKKLTILTAAVALAEALDR